MDDPVSLLLKAALRHVINEPNAESGFARIRELTGSDLDDAILAEAVHRCLASGLVRDPVRLPAGALQCYWHLELTPQGVAAARAQLDRTD